MTSRGIQQARSLADRLAGDEIDLCVASGTLRAVQTAEIVGTALSIPLMKTPLLDDPPAGFFEDGPVEDFVRWMSGFTLLGTVDDDWDGRIVTENHWVIDPAERLARA